MRRVGMANVLVALGTAACSIPTTGGGATEGGTDGTDTDVDTALTAEATAPTLTGDTFVPPADSSGTGDDTSDTGTDPCEPFGAFAPPTTSFTLPAVEGQAIAYADVQAAFPEVDWSDVDRLYIPGGSYLQLQLGNLPERTADDPLVITNQGGQVRIGPPDAGANYLWSMGGGSHWILTGRYDPEAQTGSEDAPGHRCGDYATARGHYGFWSDDDYAMRQYLHMGLAVGDATAFEIEFIEVERSGFAGIRLLNSRAEGDPEFPMADVSVHDTYVHDTAAEGYYFGWTGAPPSNPMPGLRVYRNRLVRTGNEALQVQDLGDGTEIHHNVMAFAGLHWRDNGLGSFQDNNAQISTRAGTIDIHDNVFLGAAGTLVSFWSAPQEGDGPRHVSFTDNHIAEVRNLAVYVGGSSDDGSSFSFVRNTLRGLDFTFDELDPAATAPTSAFRIAGEILDAIDFTDNTWDGDLALFSGGGSTPTELGNVNTAVTPITFVDSGYPDDAPVLALESWVASSPLSPGDPPRQYEPGELVMFDGAMYRAIATNTNETPPDHPASWALVPAAPDDLRATPGSTYDGIGLP